MKTWVLSFLAWFAFCTACGGALGSTWRELLSQAGSYAAAGNLDSADAFVDLALSQALAQYSQSDTTTDVRLYREGVSESYYFASFAEAESLFSMAARIREKTTGPRHPELARILYESAEVYMQDGKYSEAKTLYEQTLLIRENALGAQHPDVGRSLRGIAEACAHLGEAATAESLYSRGLLAMERALGADHPEIARLLTGLAITYIAQGKDSDAEALFERALAIRQTSLDADHPDIGDVLFDLAKLYHHQGKRQEAEALYKQALAIRETAFGVDHTSVGNTLNDLANLYTDMGRYEEAEPLHERALSVRERVFGPDSPEVANSLNNLANLCYVRDRYEEAILLHRRALAIRENRFGANHADVAQTLDNLGIVLYQQGQYAEAESILARALGIYDKILVPDDPRLVGTLNSLAGVYMDQTDYDRAQPLLERAARIARKASGEKHPRYATILNNLAGLYQEQGKYAGAETLYVRALRIREECLGREHPDVARSLVRLGGLYRDQGRYAEAEPLLTRALAIRVRSLGDKHSLVAECKNELALVCHDQGRFADAENLYRDCLSIWEGALGQDHPVVAQTLDNLGNVCLTLGTYGEAGQYFQRALLAWEKAFGPDNPRVGGTLGNMGILYVNLGRYSEAEKAFERALDIQQAAFGPEHPSVALALNNLASCYADQGKPAESETLHRRALAMREAALGADHPYVASSLEALCQPLRLQGEYEEATRTAARACGIRLGSFIANSFALSEKDGLAYSQLLRSSLNNYLTCCMDLKARDSTITKQAAGMVLSGKGQVTDAVFERRESLVAETDSATLAQAEALRSTKFHLSNLCLAGPEGDVGAYRVNIDSLGKAANDLETQLSRSSRSFGRRMERKDIGTARIASSLPRGSVLVEYLKYDYLHLNNTSSESRYVTVVVPDTGNPSVVDLGLASNIDDLVLEYREYMKEIADGLRMPTSDDQVRYQTIAEGLYRKVWQPIQTYLSESNLVFVAPDGALNLVSFAGLVDDSGKYLIERCPIHYMSAARDIIRLEDEHGSGRGLFALGYPDYNAVPRSRFAGKGAPGRKPTGAGSLLGIWSTVFAPGNVQLDSLPGSKREVELIVSSWRHTTDEPVVVRMAAEASEEEFKARAPGNRVVHLSTHGYFLPSNDQPRSQTRSYGAGTGSIVENPLLHSGLFLAGANLHGEGADSLDAEDGALTAYEVSAMSLAGTEMVVLSACETALGKVEEGEGVYGLRRAFQVAGARTVVSALWAVDDATTSEMMASLYARHRESLPEAMRHVQLEKLSELRKKGQPDNPFTWAAFIATGDWK